MADDVVQKGQVLDSGTHRYELVEAIGSGGFGNTWRAIRTPGDEVVALKTLRIDRIDDWKALELFEREANVLQTLEHPRIPRYLDHFSLGDPQTPSGFAIAQSFVEGRTLRQVIGAGGLPDMAAMLRWFREILEVLDHLHTRPTPIIHRDVTPKNIMLRDSGEAVLIDFGTVQAAISKHTTIGSTAAGTFGYASPEQFLGRAVPASDLYGLAMSWLAVATGEEPENLVFDGTRIDVAVTLSERDVDKRLVRVLGQMTEPDAARRPGSAREVLDLLRPVLLETGAGAVDEGAPTLPAPPHHKENSADRAAPDEDSPVFEWLRARERVLALGDDAWGSVPQMDLRGLEMVAFDAAGRRALLTGDDWLFALAPETMESWKLAELGDDDGGLALSDDGLRGVFADSWGDAIFFIDLSGDGHPRVERIDSKRAGSLSRPAAAAISPDHRLVAFSDQDTDATEVWVVEWGTDTVVSRFDAGCYRGMRFTPDGNALICHGFSSVEIFGVSGGSERVGARMALSPDGRHAAIVAKWNSNRASVGSVTSVTPFEWTPNAEAWARGVSEIRALTFAPDSSTMGFTVQWEPRGGGGDQRSVRGVEVVGLDGSSRCRLSGPSGVGLDEVETAGFSLRGDRLFVHGSGRHDPAVGRDGEYLFVWHVAQRRFLGLVGLDGSTYQLVGESTSGVIGALDGGLIGRDDPREFPEVVQGDLLGGDPDASLSELEAAAFDDYRLRYRFLRDALVEAGDGLDSLDELVDAGRALTHLLPHAVELAGHQASEAPRFGRSEDERSRPASGQILRALETLGQLDASAREDRFQAMIDRMAERARSSAPARTAGRSSDGSNDHLLVPAPQNRIAVRRRKRLIVGGGALMFLGALVPIVAPAAVVATPILLGAGVWMLLKSRRRASG